MGGTSTTVSRRDGLRRCRLAKNEEESEAQEATKALIRREARAARTMSFVSLLLATASAAMMASVATRYVLGPQGFDQTPLDDVIGQSAIREERGGQVEQGEEEGEAAEAASELVGGQRPEQMVEGWHRTYLNAVVRSNHSLDSERIKVLEAGSLVYVAEIQGRRARILKPVAGWMSLQTEDGIQILRPDMTFTGSLSEMDIQDIFRSRRMREANEKLQASAIKMTAIEKRLRDTLKNMDLEHLGHKLQRQVPIAGKKLADHATHAFKRTVKAGKAKDLLTQVKQSPHVQGLVHHSGLHEFVGQVRHGADAIHDGVIPASAGMVSLSDQLAE